MDIDEAIALEEQHNAFEQERRAKAEARRQKLTMPTRHSGPGRFATQEEFEKAMWAFMNHKPTDSDMEDDDEEYVSKSSKSQLSIAYERVSVHRRTCEQVARRFTS